MVLPHFTLIQWAMALTAALCVGLSKSGLPGVALISVLLMAELMPARQSTGVMLPLLICGDFFAVGAFRTHVRWPYVWRTLPPAVAGIYLGYRLLMLNFGEGAFRVLIGSVILGLVVLQAVRNRRPALVEELPAGGPVALAAGIVCGVTSMVSNAAGPIMAIYLIAMRLPQFEFVGTAAVFFLIVNLIKVPFSMKLGLINGHSLSFNVVLAPVVGLGVWTGRTLITHIPRKAFETIVLALAAVAAMKLIADGIF